MGRRVVRSQYDMSIYLSQLLTDIENLLLSLVEAPALPTRDWHELDGSHRK